MPAHRLISLLVLLGLTGCSSMVEKFMGMKVAKKMAKNKRDSNTKVVGVIDMVNPEQNYVLINCDQRLNLPPGTEIIAQNADGSKAKLKITPEHKGNYITADIKEGTPQVRDLVLYQIRPGELPPPPAPGTPALVEPVSGPPIQLTPVMQADVIPPLDAPFQPIAPIRSLARQPMQPQPPPPTMAPAPAPAPAPIPEPELDTRPLPPVVR